MRCGGGAEPEEEVVSQGRQTARRTARAKVEAVWGTTLDSTDSPSRRCRCQSSGLVIVSVVEEEDDVMADEFGRMALAFLVSSNERHVGRLRGNRARVATTTDAMLTMATAMERETDGSERGGARLSLPGSQGITAEVRHPRGRDAGRVRRPTGRTGT